MKLKETDYLEGKEVFCRYIRFDYCVHYQKKFHVVIKRKFGILNQAITAG